MQEMEETTNNWDFMKLKISVPQRKLLTNWRDIYRMGQNWQKINV